MPNEIKGGTHESVAICNIVVARQPLKTVSSRYSGRALAYEQV
jgi:hypothetical protein